MVFVVLCQVGPSEDLEDTVSLSMVEMFTLDTFGCLLNDHWKLGRVSAHTYAPLFRVRLYIDMVQVVSLVLGFTPTRPIPSNQDC